MPRPAGGYVAGFVPPTWAAGIGAWSPREQLNSVAAGTWPAALTPTAFTGLELWLDATYGTYDATSGGSLVTADSTAVARWEDRSGKGRHFTQSTSNNRPALRTGANGLNSLPVLSFDGTNDSLSGDSTQYVKSGSAVTVFVVFNVDSTAGSFPCLFSSVTNTASHCWRIINSNNVSYSDMSFGSSSTMSPYRTSGVTRGTWYSYVVQYNGSGATTIENYSAATNGVASSLNTSGGFGQDNGTVAAIGSQSNAASYLKGKIAEICVFSQFLSTANLVTLTAYAKSKWGHY